MNCESCKNKHASVFFADESGGRHALCSACAESLGKISPYSPASEGGAARPFIPQSTLLALKEDPHVALYQSAGDDSARAVCPYCATPLDTAIEKGRVGCPECYVVFSDRLFPSSLSPERAKGARMPSSYKAEIDRTRSISELKVKIRSAVESENYELAATLRDKIRRLEGSGRAARKEI
ncbi:MAG: UvrB/UvrC motif-containing protein [Clostridia bacterium]|nr:UvrB/UvrC motif-containing protein [Clostridia bacterium]